MPDTYTPNLRLLLLLNSDHVSIDTFNNILQDADTKIVSVSHLVQRSHWAMWQENTAYSKGDIVRCQALESHQYMQCIVSGTTGTVEPINNITGSIFTDGTCQWQIQSLSNESSSASVLIWLSNTYYLRGQTVFYGKGLYRCKNDHTSSTFATDNNYWQLLSTSIRPWVQGVYYQVDDTVVQDSTIYQCITAHTASNTFSNDIINWQELGGVPVKNWTTTHVYRPGELVKENGGVYLCNTLHASAVFATDEAAGHWLRIDANALIDSTTNKIKKSLIPDMGDAHWPMWEENTAYVAGDIFKTDTIPSWAFWEVVKGGTSGTVEPTGQTEGSVALDGTVSLILRRLAKKGTVEPWSTATAYEKYQLVENNNELYMCLAQHTSGSVFAADYAAGKWKLVGKPPVANWATNTQYDANDLVNENNDLYMCLTPHTSATFAADYAAGKWKLVGKPSVTNWAANVQYNANELVNENNKLYMCLVPHTSSVFANDLQNSKWLQVGDGSSTNTGSVTNWITNKAYVKNNLVNHSNSLYMCLINHTSGNFATDYGNNCWLLVNDGNSGSSSSSTPVGAQEWHPNTGYFANSLVTNNGNLYICLAPHTSGTVFEHDLNAGLWKQIDSDQTVVSTPSGYAQVTKRNITTPARIDITINNIPYLCLPPIEVLKLASGGNNQTVDLHTYENTDEDQWVFNKKTVEINGTLTMKSSALIDMTSPAIVTDGTTTVYVSESEEIDPNDWKYLRAVTIS